MLLGEQIRAFVSMPPEEDEEEIPDEIDDIDD